MEILKLSKFKHQLQTLISEFREITLKERYASEQLHQLDQKLKQTESEFNEKLTRLQSELLTSNELSEKLESKVSYLQNDNAILESKRKELQETINRLLQSRESFAKVYEDSTCEMKRAIQHRDRKILILSEKINGHLSLIASIEKEAFFVKKLVDSTQHVLSDKEEVVAGLKVKLDKVATLGVEFDEKINKMEAKLRSNEDELRRKEKIVLELEAQLEADKSSDKDQLQIEDLQESLLAKEAIIQSLMSEKKALHFELGSLQVIIRKVQDTVEHMNEEGRRAFSSMLTSEECAADEDNKNHRRNEDGLTNTSGKSPCKSLLKGVADISASIQCQESHDYDLMSKPLTNSNVCASCAYESGFCESQSAATDLGIFGAELKDNCRTLVNQQDTDCSITQVKTP